MGIEARVMGLWISWIGYSYDNQAIDTINYDIFYSIFHGIPYDFIIRKYLNFGSFYDITITGWWFGTFLSIYWECHHAN